MEEELTKEIMEGMLSYLNNEQLKQLKNVIKKALNHFSLSENDLPQSEDDNIKILEKFIAAKMIEGCSEKTLIYYQNTIETMLNSLNKHICWINTEDLRNYLTNYQDTHGSSRVTIDNIRRILSSDGCGAKIHIWFKENSDRTECNDR